MYSNIALQSRDEFHVPSGQDRFDQNGLMIWGQLPLSIKVSAGDTGGAFLAFEHRDMRGGGPPRHVHHDQDEWFYVLKGEFAFEIGDQQFRLGPGDSLFAPRKIRHGWAHVGEQPGTLLTIVTPAGSFEEFILETARHPALPPMAEIEKAFTENGMTVLGPPLSGG